MSVKFYNLFLPINNYIAITKALKLNAHLIPFGTAMIRR